MTTNYEVSAEHLIKRYKHIYALNDVSFNVNKGEIFGLIGPDGAGKTTILRILAGLIVPDSGEAYVCGYSCRKEHNSVKDKIAYMSQKFGLYSDLTVYENIKFYGDLYGVPRKELKDKIWQLLDFSYMRPFKDRLAGRLSGGMKQKLQLICALVHKPSVLLLDEPTNGVDPVSRRDFWRILYQLASEGMTIVMSTAYLDEAERCTNIILLNMGQIISEGSPHEVSATSGVNVISVRRKADIKYELDIKIKNTFGEENVHIFGDRYKLFVSNELFHQKISSVNISIEDASYERPSLEDIFINLQKDKSSKLNVLGLAAEGIQRKVGNAILADQLTKRFGEFTAVNKVNVDISYGEIFGFLGPNGAGKSTTIKMLCGLLIPTEGTGNVGGFDIFTQPDLIKKNIGYMSQKFSLYEDLKIYENIDFYGGIYGLSGKDLNMRRSWALELSGLNDRANEMTFSLTGGWRQRLALACSILHKPSIVFLDEPTSGADPASRKLFWEIINELASNGTTVLVSTHYMEESEYCGTVSLIFRGNMVAMGTPEQLKSESLTDTIIEIKIPMPQLYLEEISKIDGVTDAVLFGAGVHVRCRDEGLTKANIHNYLLEKNLGSDIKKILPSMEDVFVSMVEQASRGEV